jgi:hypothetical protein
MGMIRHQTPRENIDAKAVQLFGHEIEVGPSIAVSLENGYGSYTTLRHVMWIPRCYHSGNAPHAQTLVELNLFGQEKIGIVSPEFTGISRPRRWFFPQDKHDGCSIAR